MKFYVWARKEYELDFEVDYEDCDTIEEAKKRTLEEIRANQDTDIDFFWGDPDIDISVEIVEEEE